MQEKRYNVLFSGRVQGVGFRFTSKKLAAKFNIKGWVKNLSDGKVEISAEAEEGKLRLFLAALQSEFKGYISNYELKELPAQGDYKDFQIKFY